MPSTETSHFITLGPMTSVVVVPPHAAAATTIAGTSHVALVSDVFCRATHTKGFAARPVPVRTCSYPGRNDRAPLRTVRRNRTVAELAIVSPVRCDWCGLANEAGNHAS